jgi:hypothetical protein
MSDLLGRLDGGEILGLVAILGGVLVFVLGIAALSWRRVRLAELEASLKQQMLTREMSAAEIEQVLRATGVKPPAGEEDFTGDPAKDRVELIKLMLEYERSADDIARVLRAFQDPAGRDEEQAKPLAREKANLVKDLLENEMSGEEVERVLRAFEGRPEAPPDRERVTAHP